MKNYITFMCLITTYIFMFSNGEAKKHCKISDNEIVITDGDCKEGSTEIKATDLTSTKGDWVCTPKAN